MSQTAGFGNQAVAHVTLLAPRLPSSCSCFLQFKEKKKKVLVNKKQSKINLRVCTSWDPGGMCEIDETPV